MARPPRAPEARAVADRLHSAAIHLLRRLRRTDVATGVSAAQLSALSVIVFAGPLTLGRLAQAEQVRPPTVTRLVAGLEAAGLVRRDADARDRRVVRVRATPNGRAILQHGRNLRVAALAEALGALGAAELGTLERAVGLIEEALGERHAAGRTRATARPKR